MPEIPSYSFILKSHMVGPPSLADNMGTAGGSVVEKHPEKEKGGQTQAPDTAV